MNTLNGRFQQNLETPIHCQIEISKRFKGYLYSSKVFLETYADYRFLSYCFFSLLSEVYSGDILDHYKEFST